MSGAEDQRPRLGDQGRLVIPERIVEHYRRMLDGWGQPRDAAQARAELEAMLPDAREGPDRARADWRIQRASLGYSLTVRVVREVDRLIVDHLFVQRRSRRSGKKHG